MVPNFMPLDPASAAKRVAAYTAVNRYIKPGMTVGLGSGSTAVFAVHALAQRILEEGLKLKACVATSKETAELAVQLGISLRPELTPDILPIDITIDGADEVDPQLNLIKGGGGASLREKLVAVETKREIIVIHSAKKVQKLGHTFPLPVVVVPYAWKATAARVEAIVGRSAQIRTRHGQFFFTDDGLHVLDVAPGSIDNPAQLEKALKSQEGVVDVGLFLGIAKLLLIGHEDGRVEEFEAI
jgi:ribose 5-phosphate isomerase A